MVNSQWNILEHQNAITRLLLTPLRITTYPDVICLRTVPNDIEVFLRSL